MIRKKNFFLFVQIIDSFIETSFLFFFSFFTIYPILGKDLGAKFVSLDELLAQSDFVIVATPLTNETRGLFNDTTFGKMKKNSVFVNIGRGKVVDTDALVKALKNHTIFAAGLDVTDPEPLPKDHELLKLPNAGEYIIYEKFDINIFITIVLYVNMLFFFRSNYTTLR